MSTPANALPPAPNPTPPAATPPAGPPAATPPPASTTPPASSSPPATPDPGAAPPVDEPGRSRSQDRIEELIAQNKAEREAMAEFADYWRNQALQGIRPPANAEPPAPPADPPPTLEQHEFDAVKWQAANAAWMQREIGRQVASGVTTQLQSARTAETAQQSQQRWDTSLADFEKANPGATRVIHNPALQINPIMREVIMQSENGPAIAHHLGSNPLEALRISRLPPALAAAEMGVIRAALKAQAAAAPPPRAPAPQHSNAPPPPSAPGSTGAAPGIDLATCSLDDYLRIRLEQRAARRAGR